MVPYTYLIGWSKPQIYYYGVRTAKKHKCLYKSGCNPYDLWVTYFTSSQIVNFKRRKYGEPNIIQIRKTFHDPDDAINWEHKVLRRLKATTRKDFLNKTDNRSPRPEKVCTGGKGVPKGTISPIKGKKAAHHPLHNKTKYFNVGDTIPDGWVWGGIPKTPEHNRKNRLAHVGHIVTEEARSRMSRARKGKRTGADNSRSAVTTVKGKTFSTRNEAAEYFNVSTVTIRRWIKDRKHDYPPC